MSRAPQHTVLTTTVVALLDQVETWLDKGRLDKARGLLVAARERLLDEANAVAVETRHDWEMPRTAPGQ